MVQRDSTSRQGKCLPVFCCPLCSSVEVSQLPLTPGSVVATTLAGTFGALCLGLAGVAQGVRAGGQRVRPVPSDVAIILGAYTDGFRPSPPLKRRLRAGLNLYRNGMVRHLIVSGGKGDDEDITESMSMKRFLILNGVPGDTVHEERHSKDTRENLINSQKVMKDMGFSTAVIVTSDYHLPRALAVASRLGINATGYASVSKPSEFRFAVREVFASIVYRAQGYSGGVKGR